jgi:hypothetical protein
MPEPIFPVACVLDLRRSRSAVIVHKQPESKVSACCDVVTHGEYHPSKLVDMMSTGDQPLRTGVHIIPVRLWANVVLRLKLAPKLLTLVGRTTTLMYSQPVAYFHCVADRSQSQIDGVSCQLSYSSSFPPTLHSDLVIGVLRVGIVTAF